MNKIKFSFFFFIMTLSAHSQKYYDSNDLKYFIDFTNRKANLKFQDLNINGPIEEFISHYGNRYTVVKGDSIHWLLQQSDKRNKYFYKKFCVCVNAYDDVFIFVWCSESVDSIVESFSVYFVECC